MLFFNNLLESGALFHARLQSHLIQPALAWQLETPHLKGILLCCYVLYSILLANRSLQQYKHRIKRQQLLFIFLQMSCAIHFRNKSHSYILLQTTSYMENTHNPQSYLQSLKKDILNLLFQTRRKLYFLQCYQQLFIYFY